MEGFERILGILEDEGISATPDEIADALWLATHLGGRGNSQEHIRKLINSESKQEATGGRSFENIKKTQTLVARDYVENEQQLSDDNDPDADIHALSAAYGREIEGHLFRFPMAPVLPKMLEMERSLRRLAHRRPSKHTWELDVPGTVDFIASSDLWAIIKRPARERWLEGVLVVEQSPTMRLWQDTVREFRHLLWRVGSFKSLETINLNSFSFTPRLTSTADSNQNRSPRSICRSSPNRVIFLFTDCLSNGWLSGIIPEWLALWEKENSTVLIQMLPESMWRRTSLRSAKFNLGTSRTPLTTPFPLQRKKGVSPETKLIPLISLEPRSLRSLSSFLISSPKNRILCYQNEPKDFQEIDKSIDIPSKKIIQTPAMADAAFDRFRATASPYTLDLARYLAIAPLFLPVMRLVQYKLVPNSQPAHLAELFNSGILHRISPPVAEENVNQIEYDFHPGIRDKLLSQGSVPRISEVWHVLSEYLNERYGQNDDFLAILHDPSSAEKFHSGIRDEALRPFARVARSILGRLAPKNTYTVTPSMGKSKAEPSSPPVEYPIPRHRDSEYSQTVTPLRERAGYTLPCMKRVLIIENDPRTRQQILSILTQPGYIIRAVEGEGYGLLENAKRMALTFRPHVVVTELRLLDDGYSNDRSGLELLHDESFAYSRCILFSAYLNQDYRVTRDALTAANVADVVGKESSPRRLVDAVVQASHAGCICKREFSIEWPSGWNNQRVITTMFDEADVIPSDLVTDILGHIFPNVEKITLKTLENKSSPSVFRGRSVLFQASTDNKEPFVIKLAPRSRTEKEIKAYRDNIEDRLGGRFYAQLHDFKIFWELGGTCYRFIGSDQETIKPFTAFYQEQADSVKVIKPLRHFFEQVWRSHFLDSQERSIGNIFSSYDAFLKLSQRLGDPVDHQPEVTLEGMSGGLLNPLRWILDHKEESVIPSAAQAITHGDLHGDNLFVDEEHAWAIDFERSRLGPVLRDFVELEVDIVTRLVTLPAGNIDLLNDWFTIICTPISPTDQLRSSKKIRNGEITKVIEVISALRSMAYRVTGYRDIREYYWGLLCDVVFIAASSEVSTETWLRAILFGSVLCNRLENFHKEWPLIG